MVLIGAIFGLGLGLGLGLEVQGCDSVREIKCYVCKGVCEVDQCLNMCYAGSLVRKKWLSTGRNVCCGNAVKTGKCLRVLLLL